MTFNYRLGVTEGRWKQHTRLIIHDLLLVKLFQAEYYRDLEVWLQVTQGHSNW